MGRLLTICVMMMAVGAAAFAQQYQPEGQAFVCVNGTNRFTRALYGSHTDWRVETSDRPVFALVKKNLLGKWNGKSVKQARKMEPDCATGATFSSKAVIKNVQTGLDYYRENGGK